VNTAHHTLHILLTVLLLSLSYSCQAESWSLKDKDGVRYTSAGMQGRWVLVNFWAPWCPTCLQEIPELDGLQAKHKDVQVIGVAVMYKNRKEVMEIVHNQPVTYPVVFGSEDTASDFGGMPGLPTSFLYSPSGKLVGRHSGPLTQHEIEQAIEQGSTALFSR
jgi:thiol-disulfide isomerase/thioredoxin